VALFERYQKTTGRTQRWAQLCFLIALVIAAFVLLAWLAGAWRLTTFGNPFVPMAPSTAIALLALAGAALAWLRHPSSQAARRTARVIALLTLVATLFIWGSSLVGIRFPSILSLPSETNAAGIPIGRMSPLTAIGCALASLVLLLLLLGEGRGKSAFRQVAAMVAVILLLLSSGVALSYVLQAPLFYSGATIPVALLTAVSLLVLGFGLLACTGSDTWPMALVAQRHPLPSRSRRFEWGVAALALVLGIGIAISGYAYLRHERNESRREAAATVSTIAEGKVRQVAAWYRERRADALAIAATPLREVLRNADAAGPDEQARGRLLHWLRTIQSEYDFASVALVAADGRIILQAPESAPSGPALADDTRRALRSREIVIRDVHRAAAGLPLAISMFVPLETDANDLALVLQADIERSLLPQVESWPAQSETAEAALVRRDGNEVVFLTAPKHSDGERLSLRRPIRGRNDIVSARAASGEEGVFEGPDYRGVHVVAALRRVPGTPWSLVAKVDGDEIYLAFRRQIARTALLLAFMLLAAGAGLSVLWYRRNLLSVERELVLHDQLRTMIDTGIVGVVIAGANGEVLDANDYYLRMLGFTREEFEQGKVDWREVTPPEWREADEKAIRELRQRGKCDPYEKEYLRRDGTRVPVLLVDAMLPGEGERIAAFALDLSDRKQAEEAVRYREQLLNQVEQIAKVGGWEFDPATGEGSWTPEVARIHDLDPDSSTSVAMGLEFYVGESRAAIERAIAEAVELGKPYDLELEIVTAAGNRKWVHTVGHPKMEDGRVVRVTGSFQDITDRKRDEAQIHRLNQELEVRVAEQALQVEELRRWNEATLGRELRIIELKDEINQLLSEIGRPARYRGSREPLSGKPDGA
jgi:PAS domain S-box-containing protein